ncbi:TonB family protein [Erythrobacter mangrovi]|uniref:TonB family protein n=1 Tax=Erythrobacter mangrovi TaxID=2739433 RepID=A0A7D3XGQ6_9SPHN|nr:TonB family protein [Erythrobacter mangrovi]QKG70673.1 TonB family protein [Erythrobacter mangrovi]
MNKLVVFAASIVATSSALTGPLASQDIVVSPPSSSSFVAMVSKDLDSQLARQRFDPRANVHGIAKVRFQVGKDGQAINVVTYEGSGNSRLDAAARRAVHGLSSLAPAPAGVAEGQVVQANIIVADDQVELARLTKRLIREETARIASSAQERAVLALNLTPRMVS